jgi:hypothetical protein
MKGSGFMGTLSPDSKEYVRELLLKGASVGKGIHTPLMVGEERVDTTTHKDVTYEAVRDELYRLIGEGLVALNPNYQPYLTEKGKALELGEATS